MVEIETSPLTVCAQAGLALAIAHAAAKPVMMSAQPQTAPARPIARTAPAISIAQNNFIVMTRPDGKAGAFNYR